MHCLFYFTLIINFLFREEVKENTWALAFSILVMSFWSMFYVIFAIEKTNIYPVADNVLQAGLVNLLY